MKTWAIKGLLWLYYTLTESLCSHQESKGE